MRTDTSSAQLRESVATAITSERSGSHMAKIELFPGEPEQVRELQELATSTELC